MNNQTNNGFVKIGTRHQVTSNRGKGLIHLSQIESGDVLWLTLQDLIDHVKSINTSNFREKSELIYEKDLDPKLVNRIYSVQEYDDTYLKNAISNLETFKADKEELDFYRKTAVAIELSDLSTELQDIIYAFENNGYDDRKLKEDILFLKTTKMDKIDDVRFRKVEDQILFDDLDENIQSLLGEITENSASIVELRENKANRAELDSYRHKAIAIGYDDLTEHLQHLFDNFNPYDDTAVQTKLVELENRKADKVELDKKADKAELTLYREKDVEITMSDLDDQLRDILEDIPGDFDPLQLQIQINRLNEVKADRDELDNYRSNAVLIREQDLDTRLLDKINSTDNPYDDKPVWDSINELESSKVDYVTLSNYLRDEEESVDMSNLHRDVQNTIINKVNKGELDFYRHIDVKIEEDDLSEEVKEKLNRDEEALDELNGRVTTLETKQVNNELKFTRLDKDIEGIHEDLNLKTDLAYSEDTYRKKTDVVIEDDLDEELKSKINSISNDVNFNNLQNKVEYILGELPNKTSVTEFQAVRDEINAAKGDDLTLKVTMDSKLNKEQANELYRKLNVDIKATDLAADVQVKLNKATNDHLELINLNNDENYLHITSIERDKFNGYEETISNLLQRVIDLELKAGIQAEPVVISSSIDGLDEVPVNVGRITYHVSGEKLVLADSSRITMYPNKIKGTPTLEGNTLTVEVEDLDESTRYSISIGVGALKNGDVSNKRVYTTQFITEEVNKAPRISNSNLNGRVDVPLSTSYVTFNVECNNEVILQNPDLITMHPNVIDGDITISGNVLVVPISNLVETTTYTINIGEGALVGNGKPSNVLVDIFTTEDVKTKPIIGHSNLHNQVDVPITTTEVRFPVTTGEELIIADADRITCDKGIITDITVEENELVISIDGLEYDTLYIITIAEGALQDGDDLFNETATTMFRTEAQITKPVIVDTNGYNENQNVDFELQELVFDIEHVNDLAYDDLSSIGMIPDAIVGQVTIVDSQLIIPVELVQLTDYELIIPEGIIQDGNSLFNDRVDISFRTSKRLTEPFISDCQLHNQVDVPLGTTKAIFPTITAEGLVIVDEAKIVVEPNAKVAESQVVAGKLEVLLGNLQPDTEYTITIEAGALRDGDMLTNSKVKVNRFVTESLETPPVIEDCNLNGRLDVPLETSKIIFPVVSETEVSIKNESKIVTTPNIKIGSARINDEGNLEINVTGLRETTDYEIQVGEGAIQNTYGLVNSPSTVNSFRTLDVKTKPEIANCSLHDRDDVELDISTIEFEISCGETPVLADSSLITIDPDIISGEIEIVGNKLVIPVSNLKETTLYTITIGEGAIQDGDDLFNDELVNTFITMDVKTKPEIKDCSLNGLTDVDAADLSAIEFQVICEEEIVLVNESLITITPDIKQGEATIVDDKLVINVADVEYETEYTVTIGEGAIQNGDDLMNDEVINTFTTKTAPREDGVEWEYVKVMNSIATSTLTYKEIEDAVGCKLDPDGMDFYFADPNVCDGPIDADPAVVIEYWGSSACPTEGQRLPRTGIDDGGECPVIPMPSNRPTTVQFYTLGGYTPDVDEILFDSVAAYEHIIKVRKYAKK